MLRWSLKRTIDRIEQTDLLANANEISFPTPSGIKLVAADRTPYHPVE